MLAGGGVLSLRHTADNRVFFGPGNPDLLDLQRFERTFGQVNYALIAIEPADGDVFSVASLRLIRAVTDAAWRLPHSTRVESLVNFQHSYARGDDIVIGDLVSMGQAPDAADLERIRAAARLDPLLVGRLVSPAGDVAGVAVSFQLPADATAAVAEIAAALRALAAEFEAASPGTQIRLSGLVMLLATFGEATFADMATLVPVMLVVMFGMTLLLLRSLWGTMAVLAVALLSAVSAMGLAGWLGHVLNAATGSAPTIILTLAIADSVHVTTTVMERLQDGLDRRSAVWQAIRHNARPILLTALATAVGFLALNLADSPPLNDLGTLVAAGVLIACALSLTFLPSLLSLLPLRPHVVAIARRSAIAVLAEVVVRRRAVLLPAGLVLAVVAALGILRIDLNDMWLRYFDHRYEFRGDTDFVQTRLTGVDVLEYALESGGEGRIADPGYLRSVDAFATWLRAQPEVRGVVAFSDVMKRLHRNMHGDDPAFYAVPDDSRITAQYLLLYEMSLPFGLDLGNQIDVARAATRLTVILEERTTRELRDFHARAEEWLRREAPALARPATGMSILFSHISARNIEAMLVGTLISFLIVSAILLVALRSLRLGLLSLVPNLLPAAMGFGLWGYAVGEVGLAAAVVTSMTFGIVVDDTVHFMSHYRSATRSLGLAPPDAVRHAFAGAGRATATTTAVLVAGFLLLGLSGFEVNRSMGLLTAITLSCAMLADWFLLPPLLMRFDRRG